RHTVRFQQATQLLLDDGFRFFVEVSPHPVLALPLQETFAAAAVPAAVVASTRRDHDGDARILLSLAELHTRGLALASTPLLPPARRLDLPPYAFQRQRYWLDAPPPRAIDITAAGQASAEHPLLVAAVALADSDGHLFTGRLSLADHPWLADHAVFGTVLLPGTAFVELALLAAHRTGLAQVDELALESPLLLPQNGAVRVQLSVGAPDDEGKRTIALHARPDEADDDAPWRRHATGVLGPRAEAPDFNLRAWPPPGATPLPTADLYDHLAEAGYAYGPDFQGLRAVYQHGDT